ncbi:MAG: hypothetical protein KF727_09285 [Microbacteriaceae bacterium]|nr:hypothetical protein [Microbacteriaceae bacterium]
MIGPLTVLGVATVAAVAISYFARREWTQYAIGASVAFPQTAGVVVDGNGLPLFYLAVATLLVLATPRMLLGLARPARDSATRAAARARFLPEVLAMGLVAWAAAITIAGPRLFAGTPVFDPALGVDPQVGALAELAPSLGNLAQLGYLAMGVALVLAAGRLFPADTRLLGAALWTAVALAAVRLVTEPVWPRELLQNMPGYSYQGPERLSGTFYEPSVLGLHLVAAACYFGIRLLRAQETPRVRVATAVGLGLVGIEFVANASGTALAGLGIVTALAGIVGLVRLARGRSSLRPGWVVAAAAVTALGLTRLPALYELTIGQAERKASSFSYFARSLANERSWQLLLETGGLGVGLGGNRPSSMFFLVLSCLGVIGIVMLGLVVLTVLRRTSRVPGTSPAAWALVGVLAAAGVAVPDLSTPVIWVALAACLAMTGADARATAASGPTGPDAELLPRTPAQVPAFPGPDTAVRGSLPE